MIRIRRGRAPRGWSAVERSELERVGPQAASGQPIEFGARYSDDEVREQLYQAQGWKCCYCEIMIRKKGSPVEHFRPRMPYWWLAWRWDNLFMACDGCNGSKLQYFPLAAGSPTLGTGRNPPGRERALLIDPGREDPMRALRFMRVSNRWRPIPRRPDERAMTTIRRIALDSPDLLDHYGHFVEQTISPLIDKVTAAIAIGERTKVRSAWDELVGKLFHQRAPFQALAYDVVSEALPDALRRRWRLSLRRPG